ncbi:hypothetical protein GCM10010198_76990 [Nocardia seriolae]|nr:hypothetical protein NSERKGN1266_25500 [Nocardia seriolae]GEM24236.1 hypothetical protein NS2_24750 [Nocardia seriolae NBRC 15557]
MPPSLPEPPPRVDGNTGDNSAVSGESAPAAACRTGIRVGRIVADSWGGATVYPAAQVFGVVEDADVDTDIGLRNYVFRLGEATTRGQTDDAGTNRRRGDKPTTRGTYICAVSGRER